MRKKPAWWKNPGNSYRITILDDETLGEVTSFKLTKKSLYIGICTLIVILVLLTGALLSLTPLRFYIPGYGDIRERQEYIDLNMRADSLENLVNAQKEYLINVRSVLSGEETIRDTTMLRIPPGEMNKN